MAGQKFSWAWFCELAWERGASPKCIASGRAIIFMSHMAKIQFSIVNLQDSSNCFFR